MHSIFKEREKKREREREQSHGAGQPHVRHAPQRRPVWSPRSPASASRGDVELELQGAAVESVQPGGAGLRGKRRGEAASYLLFLKEINIYQNPNVLDSSWFFPL